MEKLRQANFQCIDAIKVSLSVEEAGSAFYRKAAKKASGRKVRDMFNRLAEEEKEHIKSLREKARFLQPALSRKSEEENIDSSVTQKIMGEVFPRVKSTDIPAFESDVEALEFGIESEKRSVKALSDLLATEKKLDVRAIILHLIVEEKRHLAALQSLKKSLLPG